MAKLSGKKKWLYALAFLVLIPGCMALTRNSDSFQKVKQEREQREQAEAQATGEEKAEAQRKLKEIMDLAIKATLVESYEFSDKASVVYVSPMWYTQTVTFKKDFLASIAMPKKASTGYSHFEVRDARSNEKVAEVTAFSQSLEVYK